mgnify:FL=1
MGRKLLRAALARPRQIDREVEHDPPTAKSLDRKGAVTIEDQRIPDLTSSEGFTGRARVLSITATTRGDAFWDGFLCRAPTPRRFGDEWHFGTVTFG